MRQAVLFLCLVAVLSGCGKKPLPTPAAPEPTPTPTPGPSVTQPTTDPNAGKPKDVAKVLSPRAVFKTGYRSDGAAQIRLMFTPDGSRLAVGLFDAKKVQIWDTTAEPKKLHEHPGSLRAFAPDGMSFLRSGKGFEPELVAADTGAVITTLQSGSKAFVFRSPTALVGAQPMDLKGPKGNWVVKLREYSTTTGQETTSFDVPFELGMEAQFLNGGRDVAFGPWTNGQTNGRVEVWNLATKTRTRDVTLASSKPITSRSNFSVSSDGKWIVAAPGGIEIYDGKTGALVAPAPQGAFFGHFVPGRDIYLGKVLTGGGAGKLPSGFQALDLNKKAVVAVVPADGVPVGFSANGKLMATEASNGDLQLWDLTQIP